MEEIARIEKSWELFVNILKIFLWKYDESSTFEQLRIFERFYSKNCEEMWYVTLRTASVEKLRRNRMKFKKKIGKVLKTILEKY